MNDEAPRTAMARAFRETTLSLIGLFQVYEVEPELSKATAEVLSKLFRRHLDHAPADGDTARRCALHALVDEMDQVLDE